MDGVTCSISGRQKGSRNSGARETKMERLKGVARYWISAVFCLLGLISSMTGRATTNQGVMVKRGDLHIVIRRDGHFIPADPVKLNFWPDTYNNDLTIEEIVKNGNAVKKGDVLLRLDQQPIQELISNREVDLEAAKLKLEDARRAFAMLGVEMKHALAVAENNAKWAEKSREAYIKIEIPLEDDERTHQRQSYEDSIRNQKEEIQQLVKMYSEDELTEETEEIVLRRAKRTLERTIHGLELSDRRWKLKLLTERLKKLEDLDLDVRSKQQALEKLRETQENQRAHKEIEVRKQEMEVKKQTTEVEKLRKDEGKFVIRAPHAGIVFHGEADAEELKRYKAKDSCKPHTTLLTIAKPGEAKAECMIDEEDIFKLRPNMPVRVKPAALPDAELAGFLQPLELIPEQQGKWKAVIKLDDSDRRLIPRMTCKIEIPLEKIENVLIVPKSAVFDRDGKKVCYVKKGDTYEVREVQISKTDGENIIIEEGVEEGEEVLLEEPGKTKEEKEL